MEASMMVPMHDVNHLRFDELGQADFDELS
jgi:hypothetical protein